MSWIKELDNWAQDYLPDMRLLREEPLSRHSSFRIGGPARRMAFPQNGEQLILLLSQARDLSARPFVLGNGTNVLFPDEGVDRLVISTRDMADIQLLEGGRVRAGAGASLARTAVFACGQGLAGLEFAHGIPGSVGGGVCMNAGAYGGELKDVLTEVTALFPDGVRTLCGEELALGYRRSFFTDHPEAVVLRAKLALHGGDQEAIKARMEELSAKRRASQPLEMPSAGSTFKRPAGAFAAATLIKETLASPASTS